MDHELHIPEGWVAANYAEPGSDTGKTNKNLGLVEPGPQTGEDDYHSKYVDPEGKFGATSVGGGEPSSYEGPHDKDLNPEGKAGYDVGQLHVAPGEIVVEQGVQHRRPYYLVTHPDEEYFYSVVPKVKSTSEEYRSPRKRTRSEALEMAYKVLNATLPESVSDQMHYTYPETEIVVKSTAGQQHM
jgi:hypothetical protein